MSPRRLLSLRTFALAALAAGSLALSGSAARAVSVGVLFDGPTDASGQHFGVSASSASAAQSAGIGIVSVPMYNPGVLSIVDQDVQSLELSQDDLHTPFDVSSRWTVEGERDMTAFIVYLVFTTADPTSIQIGSQTLPVSYDEEKVGLRLDSSSGWVLLQTSSASLGTLYYPAIRLATFGLDDRQDITVRYHLEQLLTFESGNKTFLPLPKLHLMVGITPIPEPGTALLLCVGLLGFAVRSRARS